MIAGTNNLAEKPHQEPVLFVNATLQCNVDCARCYIELSKRQKPSALEIDVLEEALTSNFLQGSSRPTVIIEGGEPMLYGEDNLYKMLDRIRTVLPSAHVGVVTNLFSLPDWYLRFLHRVDSVETTFSFRGKASLNGEEGIYLTNFRNNYKKIMADGITCPINYEVNKESISLGAQHFIEFVESLEKSCWDLDLSVEFEHFLDNPTYSDQTTPQLTTTATYKETSDYLIELLDFYCKNRHTGLLESDTLESFYSGNAGVAFNTLCENYFVTINPDGTITTNPLYTDLKGTFLGNIKEQSLDSILSCTAHKGRVFEERKRISNPVCRSCQYMERCKGGSSHVPIFDGSGECAGLYKVRVFSESLTNG